MTTHKTGNLKRKQPSFLSQKQEQVQARDLAAAPHEPLKLYAQDFLDLDVISALLQDAIIPGTNFHYDPQGKTFTILTNRFCWEEPPERLNNKKIYGRILCCLQFQHIDKVQHIDLDPQKPEEHYNLLQISAQSDKQTNDEHMENDGGSEIFLTLSGTARLRLFVSQLSCSLTDLDDMWYTLNKPEHTDHP